MTPSQQLVRDLVAQHPVLGPLLDEHLADNNGELLPYLVLSDVARWADANHRDASDDVAEMFAWLEPRFVDGDDEIKDLIGVGLVEMLPHDPAGDGITRLLGPALLRVAVDLGLRLPEEPLT